MRRHRCAAPRWIKKKKNAGRFDLRFFLFARRLFQQPKTPKTSDAKTGEAR